MSDQDKTLIIELNEFNYTLLQHAAKVLNLKSLKKILAFRNGITLADQSVEHQGLDPWVQWVSIHTETHSQDHGMMRLGDISKLKHEQIWERLSAVGITTGVWGVMNASRNNTVSNQYFVADPWTYSEPAYPPELNKFLALPVYYAKNYLDLSILQIIKNSIKTGSFILRNLNFFDLLADFWFLTKGLLRIRKLKTSFLFCAYELFSTRIFSKYRKKYNPDVNFIFLNSIAHFQHHDWLEENAMDSNSTLVFECIDRILSIILPKDDISERVLIIAGLSQHNVSRDEKYCYRQINPKRFLLNIGVNVDRVEQCMTNDAHVFFNSETERDKAVTLLSSATLNNKKAFYVETDSNNSLKLFYQFALWEKMDELSLLKFENRELPFFEEFGTYAKRTGAHIPEGPYLVKGFSLPYSVNNSDIFKYIWPR